MAVLSSSPLFVFSGQFITTLIGLGDSADGLADDFNTNDAGPDVDNSPYDHGTATFQLLSLRSVIAFGMLFGWAGALYLDLGPLNRRVGSSRPRMGRRRGWSWLHTSSTKCNNSPNRITRNLSSCIGNEGQVYLDIPENGAGQIRVMESGAVNYISARSKGRAAQSRTKRRCAYCEHSTQPPLKSNPFNPEPKEVPCPPNSFSSSSYQPLYFCCSSHSSRVTSAVHPTKSSSSTAKQGAEPQNAYTAVQLFVLPLLQGL